MSAELKYWYLHNHKLFRNLSFKEISSLCILKRFKKSTKSEVLDLPYTEKPRVYMLKKGILKLMKLDADGNEVLVDIVNKGDLFGELTLQNDKNPTEYFRVASDVAIICTFYQENLENLMRNKPDFAIKYIKYIGFNFKKVQNNYNNIFFKDAKTRLLLLIAKLIGDKKIDNNTFPIENFLTQNDLANLICTSRQTISSLIKSFEKEGLIKYSQKELHILDFEKLNNLIDNVK